MYRDKLKPKLTHSERFRFRKDSWAPKTEYVNTR